MPVDALQPCHRYTLLPRDDWRRDRSALADDTLLRFPNSAAASIFADNGERLDTGHGAFPATTAFAAIEWVGGHREHRA